MCRVTCAMQRCAAGSCDGIGDDWTRVHKRQATGCALRRACWARAHRPSLTRPQKLTDPPLSHISHHTCFKCNHVPRNFPAIITLFLLFPESCRNTAFVPCWYKQFGEYGGGRTPFINITALVSGPCQT